MMSRAAIYQLFRRIPDADDASIDAAVEALADQVATKSDMEALRAATKSDMAHIEERMATMAQGMATKADIAELRAELRAEMRAGFTLVHWMIGILTALMSALHLGTLWILFGIVERLSALETTVRAMG